MDIFKEKNQIRKEIYDILFKRGLSKRPYGDYGKIPNFIGSEIAAENLSNTYEWKKSKTVFSSPDSAQIPVRFLALKEGKNLIMASPNLEKGYLFLKGEDLKGFEKEASTKEEAFNFCINKSIKEFPKVDLVVEGSVAVDKYGNRIGKGCGYGDTEIEFLLNNHLIDDNTPITTTIHPLQLINHVPMEKHDKKLNMIVTSSEIIKV